MSKVKVIYGSCGGNTESAAKEIAAKLGGEAINVAGANEADFSGDLIILGTSTWGIGDLQDDWNAKLDILDKIDVSSAKFALFGLGDQRGFGSSFIDGVGTLYAKLVKRGAKIVGQWSSTEYSFDGSTALVSGLFAGLALDNDNEPEKTPERIKTWCEQLKKEL